MLRGRTRQELRERHGSYVDLANLPAGLAAEDLEQQDRQTLLNSECLYRVCSLIAFGLGLACLDDIQGFTDIRVYAANPETDRTIDNEPDDTVYVGVDVRLPYVPDLLENHQTRYLRKREKERDLIKTLGGDSVAFYGGVSLTPVSEESLIVHCGISNFSFEATTLQDLLEDEKSSKVIHETILSLGQLIANEFARDFFIGVFDSVPLFEPKNRLQAAWHDLVTLTDRQLPGLCPVCGRVVDRWRGNEGGRPMASCCTKHGNDFQNEQKRLRKLGDPDMQFRDKCAMKAREMRYRDDNNQRPLMNV